MEWIKVSERLPKTGEFVFGLIKLMSGRMTPSIVTYTEGWDLPVDTEFDDDSLYVNLDEAKGEAFMKQGFYESEEQVGGHYDECYLRRDVLYWLPLSALPPLPKED